MTQQWQLSGNAESVDWTDLVTAGRAYADNLVGEPAVSKVMHLMADEIERLRTENASKRRISSEFLSRPYCPRDCDDAKADVIAPQSAAKTDTTHLRNGTPAEGSVNDEGSVRDSRNAKELMAWALVYPNDEVAVIAFRRQDAAERASASDRIVPLYRSQQPTLTDAEREAVEWAARMIDDVNRGDPVRGKTLRTMLARLA